jgi:hypothetical protein
MAPPDLVFHLSVYISPIIEHCERRFAHSAPDLRKDSDGGGVNEVDGLATTL